MTTSVGASRVSAARAARVCPRLPALQEHVDRQRLRAECHRVCGRGCERWHGHELQLHLPDAAGATRHGRVLIRFPWRAAGWAVPTRLPPPPPTVAPAPVPYAQLQSVRCVVRAPYWWCACLQALALQDGLTTPEPVRACVHRGGGRGASACAPVPCLRSMLRRFPRTPRLAGGPLRTLCCCTSRSWLRRPGCSPSGSFWVSLTPLSPSRRA